MSYEARELDKNNGAPPGEREGAVCVKMSLHCF